MMNKNSNVHHFRDNSNLLKDIPDGKKSEFIRESLRLRINIDEDTYIQEQVTINELKNFYNKRLEGYENELKALSQEIESIESMKKEVNIKLNDVRLMEVNLNNLILTKKEMIKSSDIDEHRRSVSKTLIKNILYRREDPTVELLNVKYLMDKGEFKNKKEFKIYVQEYIDNNLKNGDVFIKWRLRQEDINYIKINVNNRIK